MSQPVRHDLVAVDALRGIAAFAVVLGHTRAQILLAQGDPEKGTGLQQIALAPTGFAAEAVAVFFVISGYLVGGQVIRTVRVDTFNWRRYCIRRLSRLYIVLIPALAFTAAVDVFIRQFLPSGPATVRADRPPPLSELACNLAFLQDSRCEAFGTNGSLWSLSYEFWFYVIFAAAVVVTFEMVRRGWVRLLVNAVIVCAVIGLFGWHLLALIPAWLFGAALAVWQDREVERAETTLPKIVLATGFVVAASVLSTVLDVSENVRFLIVGVAAVALVSAATRPAGLWRAGWIKCLAFVGTWSFTMYAFHRPLVAALAAALPDLGPSGGWLQDLVIYGSALLIAATCYPAYFLGERHTDRLRDALLSIRTTRRDVRRGSLAARDR